MRASWGGSCPGPAASGHLTPACLALRFERTEKDNVKSVDVGRPERLPSPASPSTYWLSHDEWGAMPPGPFGVLIIDKARSLIWSRVLLESCHNPTSFLSYKLPTISCQISVKCFCSSQTHLGNRHPEDQFLNVAFSRTLVWNGSDHKHEVVPAATKGHQWRVGVSDMYLLWERANEFWGNFPSAPWVRNQQHSPSLLSTGSLDQEGKIEVVII